jgi:hypothetical protein
MKSFFLLAALCAGPVNSKHYKSVFRIEELPD